MKRQTKKKLSQLITVLMIIILLSVPMPTYAQGTMYEVIFSDYNDTVLDTQMVEENTSAIAPTDPTRDGYNFSGWDTDFTNVTTSSAIQAQYVKTYDVTFKDDDGTILETQTIEENASAIPPGMNSRVGEAFIGWSEPSDNITGNTVIIAQYTPSYMIRSQEDMDNALNDTIDNFRDKAYLNLNESPNGFDDFEKYYYNVTYTPTNDLVLGNPNVYANSKTENFSEQIFIPEYNTNISEVDEVNAIIAEENLTSVDDIYNYIANLPNNPNDTRDYDDGGQTAYSLLVGQHGVCAGYADLTKKMMDYGGHTASIGLGTWVNADRSMGIAHAWNTVNGQTIDTMNKNKDFTVYTKTQLENYEVPFNNTAVYIKDALPQDIDFSAIVNPNKPIISVDSYVLDESTGEITVTASTNVGTLSGESYTFTSSSSTNNFQWVFMATNTVGELSFSTSKIITIIDYGTATPEIQYEIDGVSETFPVTSNAPTESATTYTVSFVDHDGSNLDTQTVEENANATAPTEPIRTGYTFTGWDVDFSNITSDLTITATYTEDVVPTEPEEPVTVPTITIGTYETSPTNQDITVTATTDVGTLNEISHTFTENGTFNFIATNDTESITKTITITNIDKTNPVITVENIDTTETSDPVTVNVSTNEGTLNTTTHTFTENGSFEFEATDNAGNTTTKTVTINHIVDPVVIPTITIGTYETNPTNQDITVTATTDAGTLNETSYTFTENGTFEFIATNDTESITKTITIDNIDKTNPVITVDSYDTAETSDPVTVNVSTNEGTLNATTHTFTENGSFEFKATDDVGNTTTKIVTISHIVQPTVDEEPVEDTTTDESVVVPTITIESYEQNPTNQDITVTATTDVGTLNEASYTFTENGSFKFIATNDTEETSKTIVIENIDKENPMITFIYDNSETTDSIIVNVEAMDNNNIDSIFTPDEEWVNGNSLEYEITENGDFLFKARDFANNIIEKMLTITNIVKTQEAPNSGTSTPLPNPSNPTEESVEEDSDTVTDEPVIEDPVVEEAPVEEPVTDDTTENDTTEEPVIEDENDVVTEEPITDNDDEEIVEEVVVVEEDNSPAPSAPSAPSSGGGGGGGFTPPMFNPEQDVETTEKEIVEKEQDEILTKVESSSSINDIATSIDSYESPEDMDDDEFVEKIMVSLDKNSNLKESSDKESVKSIITNLVKSKKSESNKEKLLTELSFNKITDEKLKSDFDEVVKNNSVKINNIADAKKVIEDASFIDETVYNVKDTEVATMIKDKLEERLIVDNENELLASNDETIVKEKLEQEKKTVKAIESIMNANKEFNFYSDLRARTYIKNLEDSSLKKELSLIYNSMKVKHSATPLETKERPETPPILIDGRETDFSIKKSDGTVEKVNPFIKNGRTLSSVRVIAESLEADVNWFSEDQRIELVKDGKVVEMQIGSDKLFVDGKEQLIDIKPIIKDGRSYFPARFIAEGLESTVLWDDEYNTVFID